MELAKIIEDIRQKSGIIRRKYELLDFENSIGCFCEIANAVLETTGKKYDAKAAKIGIEALVSWTYMIGKGLDFQKGILLKGHTGRGKTFLFKVFKEFLRIDNIRYMQNGDLTLIAPKIVNSKQINGEYQDPLTGGYRIIEKYSKMSCLVIDDIGAEQTESSNYGNKINVIAEIIDKREEASMLTFGTTNLNRMDSKGGYDDRTISRMNALFNVVSLNHDIDFRKT